ncbi:hypothetical protein ABK040_014875 [Willaertia magna]
MGNTIGSIGVSPSQLAGSTRALYSDEDGTSSSSSPSLSATTTHSNILPILDTNALLFQPVTFKEDLTNNNNLSNNNNNMNDTFDNEMTSNGMVFITLGNYIYGQLLHRRKRENIFSYSSSSYQQQIVDTNCHVLEQVNGVRCSNQNIRLIECGIAQTFLVTIDNTVYVSGNNFFGQLGVGHLKNIFEPTKLNFNFDSSILEVVSSPFHTLFLTLNGSVYICGFNYYSQFGIDTKDENLLKYLQQEFTENNKNYNLTNNLTNNNNLNNNENNNLYGNFNNQNNKTKEPLWITTPLKINYPKEIYHIYSGLKFTLFQTCDNELILNGDIQENNNPFLNKIIFKSNEDIIRKVVCGECYFLILTQNFKVFVYGRNYAGQLGLGHDNDVFDKVIELKYKDYLLEELKQDNNNNNNTINNESTVADIVDIIGGDSHIVFKTSDHQLYGCGYNMKGQLGLDPLKYGNIIIKFTNLNINKKIKNKIIDISCGKESTIYLTDKNEIFISGQLWKDTCFMKEPIQFNHPILLKKRICNIKVGGYHMLIYLNDKFINHYKIDFEDEFGRVHLKLELKDITSYESFIFEIEKQVPVRKLLNSLQQNNNLQQNVYYLYWKGNQYDFISNIKHLSSQGNVNNSSSYIGLNMCRVKRFVGTLEQVALFIQTTNSIVYSISQI